MFHFWPPSSWITEPRHESQSSLDNRYRSCVSRLLLNVIKLVTLSPHDVHTSVRTHQGLYSTWRETRSGNDVQCVTLVHGNDGAECVVESVTVIKPHPLLLIHKSYRQEFSGLCCDQMTSLWCASCRTNELSGIWVIPPCSRNAKGRSLRA